MAANSYPPEVAQAREALIDITHGAYWEDWLPALDHLLATVTAAQQQEIERLKDAISAANSTCAEIRAIAWEVVERGDDTHTLTGMVRQLVNKLREARDNRRGEFVRAEAAEARYQAVRAAVEKYLSGDSPRSELRAALRETPEDSSRQVKANDCLCGPPSKLGFTVGWHSCCPVHPKPGITLGDVARTRRERKDTRG